RIGDGGQLRPRPDAIPWHPTAGYVRHLRGYRGTLGELVAPRPRGCGRNPGEQSPPAEGALHRLRREGSVQSALRCPQVRATAERVWHCAPLRGVPRQPYWRRLPDGRELAVSRPGAVRLRL